MTLQEIETTVRRVIQEGIRLHPDSIKALAAEIVRLTAAQQDTQLDVEFAVKLGADEWNRRKREKRRAAKCKSGS